MKKIAMIGVGKLGQDCAEVMFDAGYDVVGYDVEKRNPKFPMKDTIEEAVSDRDMIFIAAPTPHDPIYGGETPTSHLPNKDFDYTIVKDVLTEVNKYANSNQLVVLISTVLPGTVRNQLRPCITNARFIYNPYLIAMGTIKWDMVNPEMVIIGTDDGSITGDASELIDFYKVFMQNDPRYEVGTWDEAESIKIFYNTFISAKVSLVNMIQDVAEINGNINVDVVTNALKKSTYRIMGPAYMQAAMGDGGACHPRDNIALRYLADRLDLGYDLFDAIMKAREVQAEKMALRCLKNGKNITIIGKAYKPSVPYTNGSSSMLVGHYIEKYGGNLNYFDQNTGDIDLKEDWTHVYLIGYWESWVETIRFKNPGAVVIDPWRKITHRQHPGEIIHYGNTRPMHRYASDPSTQPHMFSQLLTIFPKLQEYSNQIYVIDATINSETTFVKRPTEDIVDEVLAAKANGKSKFLFFAATEGFMPHIASKIHRIADIVSGTIDYNDMFMVTGVIDADEVYSKFVSDKKINNKINLLNCHYFDYITTTYATEYRYIGSYSPRYKSSSFLCLNKLNREHRLVLLERMFNEQLFDKGYYSFEGEENFKESISNLDPAKFPNIIANADMFPIKLNITDDRPNPVDIRPDDLDYYRESYFSIVTETLFYNKDKKGQHHRPFVEDSLFLSEKTYRCFALLHPFVLFSRPHSLRELQKQGFKTFSPYINESYDSIENDDLRFEAIFKEIRRLTNMNNNNWLAWQESVKPIVEYNKEFFHSNRSFVVTENYIDLFNEVIVENEPLIQEQTDSTVTVTVPSTDNWPNIQVIYENGITLNFPNYLDGGGDIFNKELYNFIEATGKSKYNTAFDWCAGHGPFGFYLIDKDKTENVVFSDSYDKAIDSILYNATANNIESRVTGLVSDTVSAIPESYKFDLVVANPPHCDTDSGIEDNGMKENTTRILVDKGYNAHREFYANIRNYLTDDADVYITSSGNQSFFVDWAKRGGLELIQWYPTSVMSNVGIYHFRLIK